MPPPDAQTSDQPVPRMTETEQRIYALINASVSVKQVSGDLGLPEDEVLQLLDNAVLKSGIITQHQLDVITENLADLLPLDDAGVLDEHPHLHDIGEVRLLAHLRAEHGYERRVDPPVADLRELHERLHREPPPSPA